jgi:hypothetical protein
MPYVRSTVRHCKDVEVDYDKELFERVIKDRWHVYENRPIRDVAELFLVMRKVVNTDRSRYHTLRELLVTHPKVIVFYTFDYELEILRGLAEQIQPPVSTEFLGLECERTTQESGQNTSRSASVVLPSSRSNFSTMSHTNSTSATISGSMSPSIVVAEWNGHKHQPIPEGDSWVYLVQYVAGAEGWNCTTTNAIVFYSLTYSYKNWHQAHGRIDRLNTPYTNLYYYYLKSGAFIDKAIAQALSEKRNFNERSFTRQLGPG